MVQKSPKIRQVLKILARIILFIVIVIGSAFISDPFHNLLIDVLGFKNPEGFFIGSWAEWSLALFLTFTLIGGVIFGSLGKKIDYFFIAILIALDIREWIGTENITLNIWLALIATIIVGNAIGFGLKLLRQKFLPRLKV